MEKVGGRHCPSGIMEADDDDEYKGQTHIYYQNSMSLYPMLSFSRSYRVCNVTVGRIMVTSEGKLCKLLS